MTEIHLLCGVPGSGKTWVARQLKHYAYVPHDDYPVAEYHNALVKAAMTSKLPVVGEAPFRIQVLVDQLRMKGVKVTTYYITDSEPTIKFQYERRTKKAWPAQHSNNLKRYDQRKSWDHRGTSKYILSLLESK